MVAKFRRLLSKPDQLRAEQAAQLRAALLPYEGEMSGAVRELVAHIDRQTAAKAGWTFIMISAEQHDAVTEWLEANSQRPMKAMRLWSLLFTRVDKDTSEILITRDELAQRLQIAGRSVSEIMSELERVDAIIRRRERVPGMRGPGRVRYFMNPVVGTHLAGAERDKAQADAPPGPVHRIRQRARQRASPPDGGDATPRLRLIRTPAE